jgi:hypothetical protein
MRILVVVLAGLLVICSFVIADQRHDLQRRRSPDTELGHGLESGANQRSEHLAKADPEVPSAEPEPLSVTAMLQQLVNTPASTEDTAKLVADTSGSELEEGGPHYFMKNRAKAVSVAVRDPEYQRASLVERRLGIVKSLPDVAEELDLTKGEVNRLFDLFAQKIMQKDISSGGFASISDEVLFQWDDSLAALLGTARKAQWLEYQQTLDVRMHVRYMGYQLAEVGVPLTEMQRRAMTPAVIAEDKRLQQEKEALGWTYDWESSTDDPQIKEKFARFADALSSGPVNAAAPYLSAEQLAVLRQKDESRKTMVRVMDRIQRELDQ